MHRRWPHLLARPSDAGGPTAVPGPRAEHQPGRGQARGQASADRAAGEAGLEGAVSSGHRDAIHEASRLAGPAPVGRVRDSG